MGRVVLLAPPNKGSELVEFFGDGSAFKWRMGPAGQELEAGADSVPLALPVADCELGVIAGNLSLNPISGALVPGPNDGKVSVDSTRLAGMTDHIVLPVSHSLMMLIPLVIGQTLRFLDAGRFDPALTVVMALRLTLGGG